MVQRRIITSILLIAFLAACGQQPSAPYSQGIKIGKPYEIGGKVYVPKYNPDYDETGVASWYGPGFHGGRTASGERFNQDDMTAAHKTLPLPSIVRVTNLDNGMSAIVRINDRGPFASGRIIDLSRAAAVKLGIFRAGTAKVRVQYLDQETRDYVSNNLANGKASLAALDKTIATDGKVVTGDEFSVVDERVTGEDNTEPLPFYDPTTHTPAMTVSTPASTPVPPANLFTQSAEPVRAENHLYEGMPTQIPIVQAPPRDLPERKGTVYFIQVGTFGVKDNADRMLNELEETCNAKIVENAGRQRTLYRVLAGPYNSSAEAQGMLSKLGDKGISGAKVVKG